ncbi:cholinergic receptor, nicotinic, beta 1 (muscle) like [Cottoperca gobio]|uniref:Acetylcholine receptor subunit beta n=1 Tax=Cottoperca gobio TaxID=56716 RepID=A0A6J2RPG2_COTGO|nr:acetylcholine receptor subunit beta-like [Cottoperca gobio]
MPFISLCQNVLECGTCFVDISATMPIAIPSPHPTPATSSTTHPPSRQCKPQIGEHQQVPAPQASQYKHIPLSRHSQHAHPIRPWFHPWSHGHKETKRQERDVITVMIGPMEMRMIIHARMNAFIIVCSCLCLIFTGASETERRLHQKLFENYDLKVRPARYWEDKVMVRVGMTLSQLVSLNEKNEEMTTNVFMNMAWTDYRLSWTPEEYEDITVLRIPPNKVWRPDIYLINNNDGQFDVALYVNVLVYSDGTVNWLPPAIYRSSCSIEVSYFPFDWQNCSMVFRSYTYDASEVELQYFLDDESKEIKEIVIDENAFTENGEWAICHKPSRKNIKEELYEDITFYLIIERKPLFYVVNIIMPCIFTSVLAIFVFYLPPGAGEKMTLSISVLITLTVFMLLLADKVPETSLGIPIIVNYVMFTMILVTFSVILSVVVLNLHHRTPSTHIMPNWVRKVFIHFLPKYIGMRRPNPEEPLLKEESSDDSPIQSFNGRQPGGEYFYRKINPDLVIPWRGRCESTVQLQRLPDTDSYCLILPSNLKSAIGAVTYMAEQLKKQDTDDTMTGDWQFIALVVDRLFLWLFVIITTLGTLAMFLDASFNYTPDNPFP